MATGKGKEPKAGPPKSDAAEAKEKWVKLLGQGVRFVRIEENGNRLYTVICSKNV